MAGTFTHWLVIYKVVERFTRTTEYKDLASLLVDYKVWAYTGAQGPDYPYVSFMDRRTGTRWADLMHYEKTSALARALANRVSREGGAASGRPEKERASLIAWYLGFLSHVLTDVIVHPVVEAIVGPYADNKAEHAHCEAVQDSLLHQEVRGEPITYSHLLDRLRASEGVKDLPQAIAWCWNGALTDIYRKEWTEGFAAIHDWHSSYLRAVQFKQGMPALFWHVGEAWGMSYQLPGEIPRDLVAAFYTDVKLPGGLGTGGFKDVVFEKACDEVAACLVKAYNEIPNIEFDGLRLAFLRDWDLDTGKEAQAPNGAPTYWA